MPKLKTALPSTATGRKRLLKLADLLEKDANRVDGIKFDLGMWGRITDDTAEISCGTTACACGLAAMSGAFAKQGLGYKPESPGSDWIKITLHGRCRSSGLHDGSFRNIMRFFDLTSQQTSRLFVPAAYMRAGIPTRGAEGERAVAKRIRAFVAGRPVD